MPQYVIERELPGAGRLAADDVRALSHKCCDVLRRLGPEIMQQWSYVTDDKIYCMYTAPSAELIRQHARLGGLPVDQVMEVRAVIGPEAVTQPA